MNLSLDPYMICMYNLSSVKDVKWKNFELANGSPQGL